MTKSPSIFASKPSRIGDHITFLPFWTYLRRKYPNSYITSYIDKSCVQLAPFLINFPYIDNIRISETENRFSDNDKKFASKYDIIFNPYPQLTSSDYYNFHNVAKENFIMSEVLIDGLFCKIDPKEYDALTKEEKCPKLEQWFNVIRYPKTIALWCFAGFALTDKKRSPNHEWWIKLCIALTMMGYDLMIFGHPSVEKLEYSGATDYRHLSLFDSIKMSLGCDLTISCDGGSSWIVGAYGAKQIVLYSNYLPNHTSNFDAFVPLNHKNNLISFFGKDDINSINQIDVLNAIKNFN